MISTLDPVPYPLAAEKKFNGTIYRELKDSDEIARDNEKLGVQNRAKEDVFSRIEALKSDIFDLKSKLGNYETENKKLQNSHIAAEEKCDLLEKHLNRAADAAEKMNSSLSSSTMSVDKVHDLSDYSEEQVIK